LGARSPLPIEVVPFALPSARRRIERLGARAAQRTTSGSDAPFVTDNGNAVVDLFAPDGGWTDAEALDAEVRRIPGVVDTGFFFGMASLVVVGGPDGTTTIEPAKTA
jgi:ribose 5-phosphate isomerase A